MIDKANKILEMFKNSNKTNLKGFLHTEPNMFESIFFISELVARRNAMFPHEHPTDSLIMVFRDIDACVESDIPYTCKSIEDKYLAGYMVPSVFSLFYFLYCYSLDGCAWKDGLDDMISMGVFDYLAAYGRSAGSTDYYDTIVQMRRLFPGLPS